jgi:hypothetical protein
LSRDKAAYYALISGNKTASLISGNKTASIQIGKEMDIIIHWFW